MVGHLGGTAGATIPIGADMCSGALIADTISGVPDTLVGVRVEML